MIQNMYILALDGINIYLLDPSFDHLNREGSLAY